MALAQQERQAITVPMWQSICGFPGYEVSDGGEVRSSKYGGWRMLKPAKDRKGYRRVVLRRDGRSFTRRVASLVLTAFSGERPAGATCSHMNHDPGDDRLANLFWEPMAQNISRSSANVKRGRDHWASKLTDAKVREIRRRHAEGSSKADLARRHGIGWQTVDRIIRRDRWKHVS